MSRFDPPLIYPDYKSTRKRGPLGPLVVVGDLLKDLPAPRFNEHFFVPHDADLTIRGKSIPLGERMVLHGKITDETGAPVRNSLVEIWQGPHRCRRQLSLYYHPPRCVSVEKPCVCVATCAYPFFTLWHGLCATARDTNVFSWRSIFGDRSDLSIRTGSGARFTHLPIGFGIRNRRSDDGLPL
jgi:hypothetical protein